MSYNATAVKLNEDDEVISVEAVEFDGERVRSAAGLWTHLRGTDKYEAVWLDAQFIAVNEIVILDLDPHAATLRALRNERIFQGEEALTSYLVKELQPA